MSHNIIIKHGTSAPDGWKVEWNGMSVAITAPTGSSISFDDISGIGKLDGKRVVKTSGVVIVYGWDEDSCQPKELENENCPCSIPPIKDPECFNYFKRDFPEYCDKDVHRAEDFFPL